MKFYNLCVETCQMLAKRGLQCGMVGSAMYLEDAKDLDMCVLFEGPKDQGSSAFNNFLAEWVNEGFEICGDYDTSQEFKWAALRRGELNLIFCQDKEFFDKYLEASALCCALKLPTKEQRILVHQWIRDGVRK
jgi:hypothetical protein